MQIVPSIDILGGQCVRLQQGDYGRKTTYAVRPEDIAEQYLRSGARSLHVVDLDGAKDGQVTNWDALGRLLTIKGLEIQVGGGIRTEREIEWLLKLGARRVVIGSVAVESPDRTWSWAKQFGAEVFIVAVDVKDGAIAHHGWLKSSGKQLRETVDTILDTGVHRFLCTDIHKDGTLKGPNLELYRGLAQTYPQIDWYASGGVSSVDDVRALKTTGVAGAIVGKALFDGRVRLEDLVEAAC